MITTQKRDFLSNDLPKLLANLASDKKGNFGIMTPQHMVEHLIWTTKSTANKYKGERETPPTKGQLGFQKLIKNGAVLDHRPSNKTVADLPALKYQSLEEAISHMPEAIQRFYNFWENNQDYVPYNSFMGALSFEELELFHYMHFRFHLWQFGLVEVYP